MDIGIAAADRQAIADAVSRVLADTYTLYLKTHNYHWNVTGPQFNDLHAMFMTQYTELWTAVDLIAERALQRRTGARALRAVLDEIMIELMYHLPEMDNVNAVYVLDEHAISERKPLSAMRRRAKESA